MAIIVLAAESNLNFNSGLSGIQPNNLSVSSTLTFTQVARTKDIFVSASNHLMLTQQSIQHSIYLSVSSYLDLHQQGARSIECHAVSSLYFVGTPVSGNFQSAADVLGLAQAVQASRGLDSFLNLTQTVSLVRDIAFPAATQIGFVQNVAVWKHNSLAPVIAIPAVPEFTPVVLTGAGRTITLRVPEFGNTDSIELSRIQRNSRAGDLIIWRHPSWPKAEKWKYSFQNLSERQSKDFLAFIDATLGQEITLTDHEGVSWSGIIVTPEAPVSQEGPDAGVRCGGFNCEFEFQGVPA